MHTNSEYMNEEFSRSEALLGSEVMDVLREKRVILFGVGGVGSWCAETLVRTGLTHLTIVDGDNVQPSNINRQSPATQQTLGRPKVEVLRQRLISINPDAQIIAIPLYYGENGRAKETAFDFQLSSFDYILDAIDEVKQKTDLILYASRVRETKVYSSMGAAFRLDPTQVRVGELMTVKGDPLARAVRERIKRLQTKPYKKIRCVYSTENSRQPATANRQQIKGSLMQVTAVFGCTLASLVIEDVRKLKNERVVRTGVVR